VKKRLNYIALFVLILIGNISAFSQSNPKIDSIISSYIGELTITWNKYNAITFSDLLSDHEKKSTNLSSKTDASVANTRLNLLLKRNALQQAILKKDKGFSLNAAYQYNFSTSFIDAEDVVVFRQRATFGAEWDILKAGFYDNRSKIKTLKNESIFMKSNTVAAKNNRSYLISGEQVVMNFNQKKISILEKRKELNKKQMDLVEKLWSYKHITKDDYLKCIQNKTDINGQFELYNSFSDKAKQLTLAVDNDLQTPLLDIDFEKLYAKVVMNTTTSDSFALSNELIQNAKNESKYIREVGLKAYTRYNYYDVYTPNVANRSFVSVGLNLSMPLTFSSKEKRELYLVNKQLEFQQGQQQVEPGIEFLLLNYYYEYRYKLKKYFNLIEKRNVYAELLRSEKVKNQFADLEFNPNTALFILDDYWSNAVELLDLHQDMYKLLLNIKEKIPNSEISDYTFPVTIKDDEKDSTFAPPSVKAIYIWSKSLNADNGDLIADYCELNDFNTILFSYKADKMYLKNLSNFINKNYTQKIGIMIGSNKLINGGFQEYLDSIPNQIPFNYVRELHLDIEPHTFDDFKENKDAYFKKYTTLIETAAIFAKRKNIKLSVSIPLNYPDSVLSVIFNKCDNVYLMAYENIEPDFIAKKTMEEIKLNKNKIVLALRAKDFADRQQMNAHYKKLGFENVAYHDLETLLELDKKDIQVKDTGK